MRLTEFLLPPLCVLSLYPPPHPHSPLLHYQVTDRPQGNKKNGTFRIQEILKIKNGKFLIYCLPDFIALRPQRISPRTLWFYIFSLFIELLTVPFIKTLFLKGRCNNHIGCFALISYFTVIYQVLLVVGAALHFYGHGIFRQVGNFYS